MQKSKAKSPGEDIFPLSTGVSRGRICVFDLDHTLVTCNSSYWFCRLLRRKNEISSAALLRAYWYRLRHDFTSAELSQLHGDVFRCLLQGLSMDMLEKYVETFIQNYILAKLYFPAFQELRLAQHYGAYTVIMSSSPSFLVRRIAKVLGVDEWLGTEYQLDSSKRLIGIQSFIDGDAKAGGMLALAKKREVSLDQVVAYSDSYRDIPFLRLAGQPVAVNPDPKLHAFSLENKWRIL